MALTKKRRIFVEEYLKCWNATEAARRAGYAERYLHTNAPKLLQNTTIAEAIQERLEQACMGADEVLVRLAEQARADISEFITDYGAVDWDAAKRKGHLIKRVVHNKGKNSSIELHDSQSALALIGKHHGLFIERQELEVIRPIEIGVREVVVEIPPEDGPMADTE